MQKVIDILEITTPLRNIYSNLTDEEFKIVLAGLMANELKVLHLIYGENCDEFHAISLTNAEKKTLLNILEKRIPKRVQLISDHKKSEKITSVKKVNKLPKTKTIYDYFSGFKCEEVDRAINKLELKDYQELLTLCNNDFEKPIVLTTASARNIHDKIKRRLYASKSYATKNMANYDQRVISKKEETAILKFLNSKEYQTLLEFFDMEEAICYAMDHGLVGTLKYSNFEIGVVLNRSESEVTYLKENILRKLQSPEESSSLKK